MSKSLEKSALVSQRDTTMALSVEWSSKLKGAIIIAGNVALKFVLRHKGIIRH